MKSIWDKVADAIIAKAKKRPWLHIRSGSQGGTTDPVDGAYMERYWLLNPYEEVVWIDPTNPHNFGCKRHQTRLPSVRVHRIKQSDDDRACHDHPWWFLTVILKGGYYEVRPNFIDGKYVEVTTWHGPGSILFRKATDFHRIVVPTGGEAWTMFTTGRWVQVWGFLANLGPSIWAKIPYKEYLNRG